MATVRRLGVTSLTAIGDSAAGEVVRRELDVDVVARGDADAEPAQPSREACEDRMAVLELDFERRAGERLDDAADEAQRVFFDDGGQGLAALFAAAALASARRGNGSSFGRSGIGGTEGAFALGNRIARDGFPGDAFRRRNVRTQRNFPIAGRVVGTDMITSAIVFGMVGVAAGFTWDYVVNRGK
jgi:hypothetical protein